MLLDEVYGNCVPNAFTISHASFLVQIYNLPPVCMTREVGTMIGSTTGEGVIVG